MTQPPKTRNDVTPVSLAQTQTDDAELVQIIDANTKRMAGGVVALLATMGLDVQAQPLASRVMTFGQWRALQPEGCAVAQGQLSTPSALMLLAVPPGLVSRLTDIFFGGSGESAPVPAALSLTEVRIWRRLAADLLACHARALGHSEPAHIVHIETERDNLRQARADDAVVIQSLTLGRGKTNLGQIDIVHMAARLRKLGTDSAPDAPVKEPTDTAWRARLADALTQVHLPVRVILAQPEMSVERLISLSAGDIIPIILPNKLPLIVSGTLFAFGSIGEANGRAALCIEQVEGRKAE